MLSFAIDTISSFAVFTEMASIRWQLFFVIVICVLLSEVKTQVNVNEIRLPETNGKSVNNTSNINTNSSKSMQSESKSSAGKIKPRQTSVQQKLPARQNLVCPGNDTTVPLFTLPCERIEDCALLGSGLICCTRKDVRFKRCLKGIPASKPELPHAPWLRVFPRKCPESPIAEFREVKNCTTDFDCMPRICCPERGTSESYCRTAAIEFDNYPTVKRMLEPITSLAAYLQCTPPPPPVLDLFPKECNSALDCFPNLCCQERGRRVCRPPRQSILSFFAGVTRRIASSSSQMTNNLINSIRN